MKIKVIVGVLKTGSWLLFFNKGALKLFWILNL